MPGRYQLDSAAGLSSEDITLRDGGRLRIDF
jgi:hypothetical protein